MPPTFPSLCANGQAHAVGRALSGSLRLAAAGRHELGCGSSSQDAAVGARQQARLIRLDALGERLLNVDGAADAVLCKGWAGVGWGGMAGAVVLICGSQTSLLTLLCCGVGRQGVANRRCSVTNSSCHVLRAKDSLRQ